MGDKTKISWTDATWSVFTGCSRKSPGCAHCYSERLTATRLATSPKYKGLATLTASGEPHFTGEVRFNESELTQPLRWKKPRMIFVNSMSDTFHENVQNEWLDRVFAIMALCPQHTFQVLTKRPERMLAYLTSNNRQSYIVHEMNRLDPDPTRRPHYIRSGSLGEPWPIPNVWLGTSVEDQQRADERIPSLLQTPAAIRFLSCEPLLGPIDLEEWIGPANRMWDGNYETSSRRMESLGTIHWIITGGESGPGARQCRVEWIRDIVGQCREASVSCFVKQLGADPREWDKFADGLGGVTGGGGIVRIDLKDRKGGDPAEWPEEFRRQEFPNVETRRLVSPHS